MIPWNSLSGSNSGNAAAAISRYALGRADMPGPIAFVEQRPTHARLRIGGGGGGGGGCGAVGVVAEQEAAEGLTGPRSKFLAGRARISFPAHSVCERERMGPLA
jgi:hypothetical protein